VGLTTGTATAALAELHPDRRRATTLATVANMGGLGLGPVLAGLVATVLPGPTTTPFVLLLVLLLPAVALVRVPETARPQGAGWRHAVRPQRLALPRTGRRAFAAAAVAGFAAFVLLGLFTSLTSSLLARELADPGPAIVGLAVTVTFAASVACQLAVARMDLRRAALGGLAALPVGAVLVVAAVSAGSLTLFLAGAVVGGAGIGLSFQAALSRVAQLARDDDRGAVTSTFFVAAYLGITVPVVGVGELATATGLVTAAVALAVLVAALAAAGAVLTARSAPVPAPAREVVRR